MVAVISSPPCSCACSPCSFSSSALFQRFLSPCARVSASRASLFSTSLYCHFLPQVRSFKESVRHSSLRVNSGSISHRFATSENIGAGACHDADADISVSENERVEKENYFPSRPTGPPATVLPEKAVTVPNETEIEVCEPVNCSKDDRLAALSQELAKIYEKCRFWIWRDYKISYVVVGSGPAIVLVHGFGASIGHWRRNIGALSSHNTVYALDLLGFGNSSKPVDFQYTMETWAELLLDFVMSVVRAPAILVGNSIGSLACLIASSEDLEMVIRGTILLNCAGGMNNKAFTNDWRLIAATPLLWIIDFLLKQRMIASFLFNRLKSKENLKAVLQSVYANKDAVDDELIEIISRPAEDYGALDAFVSIVTGPPGPSPMSLMNKIRSSVLVLWGDKDPLTPIDGPVGKYFCMLSSSSNVTLQLLPNVGHCPHDEQPESVNKIMSEWISTLSLLQ